jgi:carboxymethylenebutenolidase
MNGPYFDLEQIWDEHTYFEFENRSVEWTMSTMVQEPYVNHIPTVSTKFLIILLKNKLILGI